MKDDAEPQIIIIENVKPLHSYFLMLSCWHLSDKTWVFLGSESAKCNSLWRCVWGCSFICVCDRARERVSQAAALLALPFPGRLLVLTFNRLSSLPSLAAERVNATCGPPNIAQSQCSDIPGSVQMVTICPCTTYSEPGTQESRQGWGMRIFWAPGFVFPCVPLWWL